MSGLGQIPRVLIKELLVEWRHRARVSSLFVFAFALLLMVAFSMPNTKMLEDMAGGALWLGLLLASTRSLDQSFLFETENGALEGLVLWPVASWAVYYGKAFANALILLAVALFTAPLTVALYNPVVRADPLEFVAILVLGCAAIAGPGTLVAALTVQARGSSALLPLLLFPLVVPAVMAASSATTLSLEGDVMHQVDDWLVLLGAINLFYWLLGGVLFTLIAEDR